MRYIAPSMKIEEAQQVQMLAESLGINSEIIVDAGTALTKEDDFLDDFDEE